MLYESYSKEGVVTGISDSAVRLITNIMSKPGSSEKIRNLEPPTRSLEDSGFNIITRHEDGYIMSHFGYHLYQGMLTIYDNIAENATDLTTIGDNDEVHCFENLEPMEAIKKNCEYLQVEFDDSIRTIVCLDHMQLWLLLETGFDAPYLLVYRT